MTWTITIKDPNGEETRIESADFMLLTVKDGGISLGGTADGGPLGPAEVAAKLRQGAMVLAGGNHPAYKLLGEAFLHTFDGWKAAIDDPEVG